MDNGMIVEEMEEVGKFNPMDLSMKDIGKMTYLMAKGAESAQMAKYTKENGALVKYKEKEFFLVVMELHIQESG